MILKLISFPFIVFIPGFLLYNLLIKGKISVGLFETRFIMVLTSLLISGWMGLILAEWGYFSLLNLVVGLVLFSLILLILTIKLKRKLSFKTLSKSKINTRAIILAVIMIAGVKLFFPPGENITLHQDDAVFVSHGASIVQTGSLIGRDPLINEVKPKKLFYDFRVHYLQFPEFGFYMDLKTNQIEFQYLDFFPVLLAVFYSLLGINFFLYLTPMLALLAVTAVYIVVKHMFSWKVGILSSLFLIFSFPQIWFSRYPCAEVLTQLLVFSGLFMIILMLKHKKSFFTFFSGFIFATLMLVRLDSLFLAWAFVVFFLFLHLTGKLKGKRTLILSFSFLVPYAWALIHNYLFDGSYVFIPKLFLEFFKNLFGAQFANLHPVSFALFYGFPALVLLVAALSIRSNKMIPDLFQTINESAWKIIRFLSPFLIGIPFVLLYLTQYPYSQGLIAQKQTLLTLQFFLTPLGLGLSLIGLVAIINQHVLNSDFLKLNHSLPILLFILMAVPHIIYYVFLNLHNQPVFPWAFRRYVPLLFPFFIICLSFLLVKIFGSSKLSLNLKSLLPKIIAVGLAFFIFSSIILQDLDSGIFTHQEFKGFIKQTKSLSTCFDPNSVILFYPNTYATGLAVPLKYFFQQKTILLPQLKANNDFFKQIAFWKSKNRPVYIATIRPDIIQKKLSEHCQLALDSTFKIDLQKMQYVTKPEIGTPLYGDIIKEEQILFIFKIHTLDFFSSHREN